MKNSLQSALLIPLLVLVAAGCNNELAGVSARRGVTLPVKGKWAENHVLVVLKNQVLESEIGIEFFPEIKERVIKIEELTHGTKNLINRQILAEKTGVWDEDLKKRANEKMLVDENKFKNIVRLTLNGNVAILQLHNNYFK